MSDCAPDLARNPATSRSARVSPLLATASAMKLATAVIVTCAACSGTTGYTADELPAFEACAARACETGAVATEVAHLDALIAGATWTPHGDYTAGCLDASKNIPVAGTLTLRGAPHDAKIRLRGEPAGVACVGAYHYFDFTVCDDVILRDTTIRLRMVAQDIHPAPPQSLRLIEVLAPCEAACGDTELTCEATHTCWGTVRDHCAYCLGGSNEACGCWDGDGFFADGTTCQIAISGDISVGGTCEAGLCVTDFGP